MINTTTWYTQLHGIIHGTDNKSDDSLHSVMSHVSDPSIGHLIVTLESSYSQFGPGVPNFEKSVLHACMYR